MDADKKRLWVSGQFIEVTDEVYDAYMKGDRKMRYFESDLKTERFLMDENGQIRQVIPSREDSLDRLMDDNAEQFADRHESVEDMVLRRISIERLYKALDRLTEKERKLIPLPDQVPRERFVRMGWIAPGLPTGCTKPPLASAFRPALGRSTQALLPFPKRSFFPVIWVSS